MKKIIYQIMGFTDVYNPETDEVEKRETLATVTRSYSEANEEIAKQEAYNGEIEITPDDGQPEPEIGITTDDVLNALLGVT